MPTVNKTYTFVNGNTADATQVNQDLDTLYNLVNGGLDTANLAANAVQTTNVATEAVTPAKTEGIPYASDMFGASFILSGLTCSKDGTNANQVDVTAGVVYIQQADGSLRHFAPAATNFRTASASATYYLDFNPDGTWSWATGHSTQTGYVNVATVTSDASSNVNVITQNTSAYNVTLLKNATGPVSTPNATNVVVGSTSFPGSQSATANTVAIRDANGNVARAMPTSNGQNPNLLFNPSARLGLTGWGVTSGSAWSAAFGQNYGEGGLFQSPNIATSGTYQTLRSQQMPVTSGFALTLSVELNSVSLTAGFAYVNIEAFNASNTSLGSVIVQANPGQNWTKQSTQYTTPANTTYVTVTLGLNNAALGQAYFRKVKVEAGSYATTFSDDNTLNTVQYGSVLPFMTSKSGGNLVQSGTVAATAAGSYTVTFPVAFTTTPVIVATYDSENTSSGLAVDIASKSATAVTFYMTGGATGGSIHWHAIGS